MTKNSISLGRAVAGVCVILAIAAVIGLLGSFAPSSSKNPPGMDGGGGGISGDISGVVGNTIKKGTYRFNDVITFPEEWYDDYLLAGMSISLTPLNCSLQGESGVLTISSNFTSLIPISYGDTYEGIEMGRILLANLNSPNILDYSLVDVLFNGVTVAQIESFSPYDYSYDEYYGFVPLVRLKDADGFIPISSLVSGVDVSSYGRTFIVNEDYLTNELFATWFSNNTERVE